MKQHIPVSYTIPTFYSYHHKMLVHIFLSPCTRGGQYTWQLLLHTYSVKVKTLLVEIQECYFHTTFRKGVFLEQVVLQGHCLLEGHVFWIYFLKKWSNYILSLLILWLSLPYTYRNGQNGVFFSSVILNLLFVKPVLQCDLQPLLGICILY